MATAPIELSQLEAQNERLEAENARLREALEVLDFESEDCAYYNLMGALTDLRSAREQHQRPGKIELRTLERVLGQLDEASRLYQKALSDEQKDSD